MPNRLDDLSARGFSKTLTLDAANELAYAMFGGDARVERLGQTRRVTIDFKAIHLGAAQLMRVDLAGLSVERSTDDSLHVSIPVTGGFRRGRGDNLLDYYPMRQASIGRPCDRSKLEVTDASVLVFYVPRTVAVERAERLTGRAQGADTLLSDLSEGLDLGAPVAAALARHLNGAMAEMTSLNAIGMGRLAAAATEEMLVNLVTAAMFPRVAQALSVSHIDRGPAIVRRARDYIKAHADQPIEISKLAAELGVSLRSLQENFQRYLGYSPRDWILTCRLERARERLLVDDGQRSVTNAALDAGFSDLGHFAGKYRHRFGELPSQTLRRVRGTAA